MDPENLTCDCGKCSCKTNFVGDTCNECEIGYHDFPNCKGIHFKIQIEVFFLILLNMLLQFVWLFTECTCNSHGSIDNFCDPLSGHCPCKNEQIGKKKAPKM